VHVLELDLYLLRHSSTLLVTATVLCVGSYWNYEDSHFIAAQSSEHSSQRNNVINVAGRNDKYTRRQIGRHIALSGCTGSVRQSIVWEEGRL